MNNKSVYIKDIVPGDIIIRTRQRRLNIVVAATKHTRRYVGDMYVLVLIDHLGNIVIMNSLRADEAYEALVTVG